MAAYLGRNACVKHIDDNKHARIIGEFSATHYSVMTEDKVSDVWPKDKVVAAPGALQCSKIVLSNQGIPTKSRAMVLPSAFGGKRRTKRARRHSHKLRRKNRKTRRNRKSRRHSK